MTLKRVYIPAILFCLFIIEGTWMQIASSENLGFDFVLIPRFTMLIIMFVALYINVPLAVTYALVAGFLYDIVYTDFIGIYLFAMALTIYVVGQSAKILHVNAVVGTLAALAAVIVLELLVYGVYTLIGFVDHSLKLFFLKRVLPSLALNGIFFVLSYVPMKKLAKKLK